MRTVLSRRVLPFSRKKGCKITLILCSPWKMIFLPHALARMTKREIARLIPSQRAPAVPQDFRFALSQTSLMLGHAIKPAASYSSETLPPFFPPTFLFSFTSPPFPRARRRFLSISPRPVSFFFSALNRAFLSRFTSPSARLKFKPVSPKKRGGEGVQAAILLFGMSVTDATLRIVRCSVWVTSDFGIFIASSILCEEH